MKTVGDARAEMQGLFPSHQLWNNPEFIMWRAGVEAELDLLNDAGIAIPIGDDSNIARSKILMNLGLAPPQTAEESIRVYLSLKSVVSFWKRNLRLLESQSVKYETLEKQINAAGRTNVGTA